MAAGKGRIGAGTQGEGLIVSVEMGLPQALSYFITGQAEGTGIPSRCRQDVGGNTWKSWHRPEGLCKSSGSRATPPQSQSTLFP